MKVLDITKEMYHRDELISIELENGESIYIPIKLYQVVRSIFRMLNNQEEN